MVWDGVMSGVSTCCNTSKMQAAKQDMEYN
jgi:hypothetical protein